MNTLDLFLKKPFNFNVTTVWYLSDLSEYKGKQELYTKQTPQKLQMLKEHSIIESAVSSNRIEGIEVSQKRIGTLVFGNSPFIDRNEEEFAGYRKALKWIHENHATIAISEKTIKHLHLLIRGDIWDAGKYKEKNNDIIEKYPDGRERIRFKTVDYSKVETSTNDLILKWNTLLKEKTIPPLVLLGAFNLDFLCIHPFRDGNGRVSRLLLLLQSYHLGLEVGKYISLERIIEQNKERYYETLESSSVDWHASKHDYWPFVNYILYILKLAFKEFEERFENSTSNKGDKTEQIKKIIFSKTNDFNIQEIHRELPNIGIDLIRLIIKDLQKQNKVKCLNRGKNALWRYLG